MGLLAIRSANVSAFHKLHHQELLPFGFFEAVKRCDVRVIQLREKTCPAIESLQPFFVSREFLGKEVTEARRDDIRTVAVRGQPT